MAASDTVNRIYREFKRYTGDGLPGEPTGAALPIGDPQSGPYSPKKSELRAAFIDILGVTEDMVDDLLTRYLGALVDDAAATAAAGTPITGQMYFNTTVGKFRVWNGVSWQDQSVALNDGDVTEPKHATGGVSTRALANLAVTLAKLAAGAVNDSKVAADAAIAATKLSVLQAGTDAVARDIQFFLRNRTPTPLEFHADAAMNVTTTAARNANKLALQRAFAANTEVRLPTGIFALPNDAEIHMGNGRRLIGAGSFAGGTRILGDGRVLIWDAADGLDSRAIEAFRIENETLADYDVLLSCNFAAGITECRMTDIYFAHALRHFTLNGFCVGWKVQDCTFEYATGVSRVVGGSTVYKEINCYTKGNAAGLQLDGAVYGHYDTYLGGIFEQSQGTAILIKTITSDRIVKGFHTDAWFEANGLAGGSGDIRLQATGSGSFANISVWDASFPSHVGTTQTVRIDRSGTAVSPTTGGKYFLEGSVPLTA